MSATVFRTLHINRLYSWKTLLRVPLSVQSEVVLSKYCRQFVSGIIYLIEAILCPRICRNFLCKGWHARVWREKGTRNYPQNIGEHHVFRVKNIMVWAGISLGYRICLIIFRRSSVTAINDRDKLLNHTVRLYASEVGPIFFLMDNIVRPP